MIDPKKALLFAVENPYSDFYRKKYGTAFRALVLGPLSKIPLLTRSEIEATPIFDRLFLPKEGVKFYRSTSGSSGRRVIGIPMFEEPELALWRERLGFGSDFYPAGRYFGPYFKKESTFSLMVFSAMSHVHEAYLAENEGHATVMGDYLNPELSAKLAIESGTDTLMSFASPLISMSPVFVAAGIAQKITFILIMGERIMEAQRKKLVELYPNARIAGMYAATEAQTLIGHSCRLRETTEPNLMHIYPTFIPELIHPETGEVIEMKEGASGELCLTATVPLPFALIRYRTGDFVVVRKDGECACGISDPLIEVLGRTEFDRIKVPFGGITTAALESAIHKLPMAIVDFEATWREGASPRYLEVTVYSEDVRSDCAEILSSGLAVSSTKTYTDLVALGEVGELILVVRDEKDMPAARGKRKRLHIEH